MEINLDLIIYFSFAAYKIVSASDRTAECIYLCIKLAVHGSEMQHWNVTSLSVSCCANWIRRTSSSRGLLGKATKTSGLSTWMSRCLRRSGVLLLSSLSPFGHFSQEKLDLVGREAKFTLEGSWGSSFPFQLTQFQWLRELIIVFYWLVIYPLPSHPWSHFII